MAGEESVKRVAIVLAAGSGKRMGSSVPKQFMDLCGKPLICYSLEAFEKSRIDQVILVTSSDNIKYCQEEIVDRFGYHKVSAIVAGGAERYDSVYAGLCAIDRADYVFIHDGARPLLSREIIETLSCQVEKEEACVAAVPVKDTIKVADESGYALSTPDRSSLWIIQTPQVFSYDLIKKAYDALYEDGVDRSGVTDDAMLVETFTDHKVKLVMSQYTNIKVTTPEDITTAEGFLKQP